MTRNEQSAAILRRAAADFLAVAPARAPRVANPDPAVVAAVFHLMFWREIGIYGNTTDQAESYAAWAARGIGAGFYTDKPHAWQYLRDMAKQYAA
jgi:hypothetical protein